MRALHSTYCDSHFMMYVSQIFRLYSLNLYSAVCQLYRNKIGRKKSLHYFLLFPYYLKEKYKPSMLCCSEASHVLELLVHNLVTQ